MYMVWWKRSHPGCKVHLLYDDRIQLTESFSISFETVGCHSEVTCCEARSCVLPSVIFVFKILQTLNKQCRCVCLKFCFKLCETAVNINNMLKLDFGEERICRTQTFKWFLNSRMEWFLFKHWRFTALFCAPGIHLTETKD